MAPGGLSILAPFLGRKSKKYEKLETDDPEKRRQEATEEELNRLNAKIGRLVSSMSREDLDPASCQEDACLMCCQSRATMQVSPCNHQSLCRLCFVHSIQDAVASRALPLLCLVCNAKIFRVKNNPQRRPVWQPPSSQQTRFYNGQMKNLPKSVSGYSLCANNEEDLQPRAASANGLPMSASSYSFTSGLSSISSSSFESNRSVRSTASVRSNSSQKSTQSNASWFSIGSLSSFQAGGILDSKSINKPPRAHSLSSSRRKLRPENKNGGIPTSQSDYSVKSWSDDIFGKSVTAIKSQQRPASTIGVTASSNPQPGLYREPRLNRSDSAMLSTSRTAELVDDSTKPRWSGAPLSPNSIDERIRVVQQGIRSANLMGDQTNGNINSNADTFGSSCSGSGNNTNSLRRLSSRDSFRHLRPSNSRPENLNIDNGYSLKGQMRRLSGSGRFIKSPDLIETTFSMSTIEEEQEIALSLKNLAA